MSSPIALSTRDLRPLRRREYDVLVEQGCFEGEHVELLYGFVVPRAPEGPIHAAPIQRLTKTLILAVGDRAMIRVGHPLALGDSEPEPDLAVVPVGDYDHAHPSTAWLVVEVSSSSLDKDRGLKARLYAEHGIDEYWIVNLRDRHVEVRTAPAADGYTHLVTRRAGERIAIQRLPDVSVAVDEILAPTTR
ncbi:MAG: Uma2 family endonuclease [Myxococcota bacterium]